MLALFFFWLPAQKAMDYKVPLFFITTGLLWSLMTFLDIYQLKDSDRYFRIVLAGITLVFLMKLKITSSAIFYGVATGSFAAFFIALYDKLILEVPRAQGNFHPILFGNYSMMLGLMALAAALMFVKDRRSDFNIMILAALAGIAASFLSGSRGAWVGLPAILIFIFFHVRRLLSASQIKIIFVSVLLVIFIAVTIPSTGIRERVKAAKKDGYGYFYKDKKTSSLGVRFEMWESAFFIFLDNPITGAGKSGIDDYEKKLVDDHDVHKIVKKYSHAHSDYMDSLSERGILGFTLLLLLYFGNLYFFNQKVSQSIQPKTKALALMGAVGALCYISFSLTESLLTKNMGLSFYCFTMIILWAAMSQHYLQEREVKLPHSEIKQK